jgi:dTDP-L-rhamnose 4-epimerase
MLLLLTGGAGFIGRAITASVLAGGHRVRVLDGPLPQARGDEQTSLPEGAGRIVGDLRDPDVVARALRGVDVVSHHAGMIGPGGDLADLPGYTAQHDVGTATLLAQMARVGVGRLILAGSTSVYGEGRYLCPEHGEIGAPPRAPEHLRRGQFEPRCRHCGDVLTPVLVREDAPTDPRSGYAVSRLAQEQLARVWARETGGGLIVLRYPSVYGPGLPWRTRSGGVPAQFLWELARGQAPSVFEDGQQRRDFVHVQDVARAGLAATELISSTEPGIAGRPLPPRVYNVAGGAARTVLGFARELSRVCNGPRPRVTGQYRLSDGRHLSTSVALIRRDLGWCPQVSFAEGIAELAREIREGSLLAPTS